MDANDFLLLAHTKPGCCYDNVQSANHIPNSKKLLHFTELFQRYVLKKYFRDKWACLAGPIINQHDTSSEPT